MAGLPRKVDATGHLMPRLLGQDYWDTCDFPLVLLNQDFGAHVDLNDLMVPTLPSMMRRLPNTHAPPSMLAPWAYHPPSLNMPALSKAQQELLQNQGGVSKVENDDSHFFAVALNCQHFSPKEIDVTYGGPDDNSVVIHGKHEERTDEHGFITREFTRRYVLPKECDMEQVWAQWTPTGQLCISCPKHEPQREVGAGKKIPVKGCDQWHHNPIRLHQWQMEHAKIPIHMQRMVEKTGAEQKPAESRA